MPNTNEKDIEEKQKKWVERRAGCSPHGVFKRLSATIEDDVNRFNELSGATLMAQGHYCCQREDNRVVFVGVERVPGTVRRELKHVAVRLEEDCTSVYCKTEEDRNVERVFDIFPEWNHETLNCDLLVDGKNHTIWQLSDMAIGDLLFGRRPNY
ncbi:MAG: hypothetical protein F4X56_01035 [Gammaproteobacteria bacterium]|nr:hypothetical protein [Gammaproteobacteria bacterium]MYC24485.1 hypothetical protein [Gammaproteobacteria bacterium]